MEAGGEVLASTEVLVAGSPAWVAAGRLPSGRAGLRGASLGGRLYMAGGKFVWDYTAEMLEFDPSSKVWKAAPPMEEGRTDHAMATVPYSAVQHFCPGW